MKYSVELKEAKRIALSAGEIILEYFDTDQGIEIKDDGTPVTKADILVNELVIAELNKIFPEDIIVGEEKSTGDYGQGRRWVCDPIDGTAGYIWGTPTAMFSLALVVDGTPVIGVVYDAFLKRMYEGETGEGSFCNGKKLEVSDRELVGGKVAVTSSVEKIRTLKYITKLIEKRVIQPVFSGAVCKSCLVAQGKFEGYITDCAGAHDMAAVQVLVGEAGGKVTGIEGNKLDYSKPFKGAVVSNGNTHDELITLVNS